MLAAAIAAYGVGSALWLGRDPRLARERFDADSVHNTGPEGTSQAFEYLRRREGRDTVEPITLGFAAAATAPDGVLFRLGPDGLGDAEDGPHPFLSPVEAEWVAGGGRIVLGLDAGYGEIEVDDPGSREVEKVFPIWPGVGTIESPVARALAGDVLEGGHAVLAAGARPVAVRIVSGRGEVFLLAVPEILRNEHLGTADHLALLDALAASRRAVYFDERIHGLVSERGMMDILRRWGLGPLLFSAAVLGVAAAWRRSRRIGPPDRESADTRREAVDLVDSLAVLYEKALTRAAAVRLYREHLSRAAALRTGLAGDALEAWVADWIRRHGGEGAGPDRGRREGRFRSELTRLNNALRELEHVERK